MKRIGLGVVLTFVGAGACSSAPPPNERLASSEAAIRGAHEVGSDQIPQAALHRIIGTTVRQYETAYVALQSSDAEIADALQRVWRVRDDRYSEIRSEATEDLPRIEMSRIGG